MLKILGLFIFLNKNIRTSLYTKLFSNDDKKIILYNSNIYNKSMSKNLFKGYDHRNNITENDDIMKVTINYEKLALLKILNNPNIHIYNKINILDENSYLFYHNISSSILNGGLFNDWDFDI